MQVIHDHCFMFLITVYGHCEAQPPSVDVSDQDAAELLRLAKEVCTRTYPSLSSIRVHSSEIGRYPYVLSRRSMCRTLSLLRRMHPCSTRFRRSISAPSWRYGRISGGPSGSSRLRGPMCNRHASATHELTMSQLFAMTDPAPYTTMDDTPTSFNIEPGFGSCRIDVHSLHNSTCVGWAWEGDWTIDTASDDVDREGWQFAKAR